MKHKISGLLFACVVLATTSASAQTFNIDNLYSTGVDAGSTPIALGATDTHWDTQINSAGWVDALYEYTNYCTSCGSVWVQHPIGDDAVARPLAHPSYVQQDAANNKFSWRTTFDIPAEAALDSVVISYKVGFDDVSRDKTDTGNLAACNHTIWVNGAAYTMTSTGDNQRTTCAVTIPSSVAYVHGQNTLEFRIQNLATYYGFRFEKVAATYEIQRADLAIFNTGVNDAGAPIAENVTDTHWEVSINSLAWMSARYGKTNYCSSCGGIWVNHPQGTDAISRPLAHPNYLQVSAPGNKFSWRQSFDIPATADLSTVILKYKVGFDDTSRNPADTADLPAGCSHTVWINNTPYSIASTGNNHQTTCVGELPANAVYAHGQNTLEFRIQNITTYYGFRFELTEATVAAPAAPVANVTITTPSDDFATISSTPTISGTATPGSTVVVIIVDENGAVVETLNPVLAPSGAWTVVAAALAEGNYTIEATSTLGNQAGTATPVHFEVDQTGPVITITAPTDGSTVYSTPIVLTGTTDSTAVYVNTIAVDGLGIEYFRLDVASGPFTQQIAPTRAGVFTFLVSAEDALGNQSSESVTVTYSRGSIAITAPAEGAMTDADVDVTGSTVTVTDVSVFLDGTSVGTVAVDTNNEWTYALTNLAPGAHSVQGRNVDGDVVSETRLFTVKMPILPAPVVITSPTEGSTFEAGAVTVSGTGEPGTTVVVTVGESMQTVTVDANGGWTATFDAVAAGGYTVTALGAEGMSATVTITVTEPSLNNGTNNGTNNSTNNGTNNSTNNGTNNGTNNETNTNTGTMAGGTDDGCGCASTGGNASSALIFLLGLFGLRIRRRR